MNDSAATIDAAGFEWAKGCAGCHPGGGPLEYDRDGHRYDERDPATVSSFDGDYHEGNWQDSGVVEADCLLCHMEAYRTARRTPQLAAGNFRVAPAAGAGMGVPRDNAVVAYDATWEARIEAPPARNCSQCHGGYADELFNAPGVLKSDVAKRGDSWKDPQNPDVHEAALTCVDCHKAGTTAGEAEADHQLGKGNIMVGSSVRNDLDNGNGFASCAGCHATGNPASAPVPAHASVPSGHHSFLHCTTCHIPEKKLFAVRGFDFTGGGKVPFFLGGSPKGPYGGGIRPAYLWWHEETRSPYTWKLYPFNYISAVFWNRGSESKNALFLKQVKPVFDSLVAAGKLSDDVPDAAGGVPEPDSALEVQDFRDALLSAGYPDPTIRISPDPFQLSHNVAPADQAIGAGGCTDCHSPGSDFFNRSVALAPWTFETTTHVKMEVEIHRKDGSPEVIEGFHASLPRWRLMGLTEQRKTELENLFAPSQPR